jgi:hypothetical protein
LLETLVPKVFGLPKAGIKLNNIDEIKVGSTKATEPVYTRAQTLCRIFSEYISEKSYRLILGYFYLAVDWFGFRCAKS